MSERLIYCCNDLLNEKFTRRFRLALPWLALSLILLLQAITPAVAISQTPAAPSTLTISSATETFPAPTGNTYYVATNGSDGNSCSAAQNSNTPKRNIMGASGGLACLRAGNADILDIRAGTYRENISSAIQTLPSGTSYTNAATIRAHTGETVTINGISLGNASPIAYLIIEDLFVTTGVWGGTTYGDGRNAPHHIRLTNLDVTSSTTNVFVLNKWTHHFEVNGGKIHDAPVYPACVEATPPPAGNGVCYNVYQYGSDNIFENIEIYGGQGYGIHQYSGVPGIGSRNIYRYNKIHNGGKVGVTSCGLLMTNGDDNVAHSNIIYDNLSYGLCLGSGARNKAYNNTIVGNGHYGVQSGGYGNDATIYVNNITYNNTLGDFNDWGIPAGLTRSNNHCANANTGCLTTENPLFRDSSKKDFALQTGSPAIDRGTALSGISATDINGTPRGSLGLGWDIGAYESK